MKNEQDIIGTFVDYHLSRGVDHLLVRDTGSADLTLPILRRHANRAADRITLIEAPGDGFDQGAWVSELARLAHTAHAADWVLHADADEFWWPHHGDLRAAFAAVPTQYRAVSVGRSDFLLGGGVGRWWERLTVRDVRRVNREGRPLHPKLCHRGSPDMVVDHGAMGLPGHDGPVYVHDGVQILHYPARTRTQFTGKVTAGAAALTATPGVPAEVGSTWRGLAELGESGLLDEVLDGDLVDAASLAETTSAGRAVVDLRLADYLRGRTHPTQQAHGGVAVIVPVYGLHHLTHTVLADLWRDDTSCTVYIVDNGGDYTPVGDEFVLRPGENLRWAGGCNHGLRIAQDHGHDAYVLLNNDVRLSRGFLPGLVAAWRQAGAALTGPVYDRNWPQQRLDYTGPAHTYRPGKVERAVPFLDGTCLLIPHATLRRVGLIDEVTWPGYGWGCDKDYALRVRHAGGTVQVTERAYLNHLGRQTAAREPWYDEAAAEAENDTGMARKWGSGWRDLLYAGFDSLPRLGLAQQRLLAGRRTTTP